MPGFIRAYPNSIARPCPPWECPVMDSAALLAQYDAHLRATAEVADADEVTRIGPVLAATFPERRRGFVTYEPFSMPKAELERLIESVAAHYAADARVDHAEWKTRGHDPLPELLPLLRRRGFVIGEEETIMAGTIEAAMAADPGVPQGYRLVRCTSEDSLRKAEDLAGRVFGDSAERREHHANQIVARFRSDPHSFEMWAVHDRTGQVVCSGRVDFVDGTDRIQVVVATP